MAATYFQAFPAVAGVYLEDSWVLGITIAEFELRFRLDVVLTPDHPDYTPPPESEQYCYRTGQLLITTADAITWEPSNAAPATDSTGERDYGNIDTFVPGSGNGWRLEGDWGGATVYNPSVTLDLD